MLTSYFSWIGLHFLILVFLQQQTAKGLTYFTVASLLDASSDRYFKLIITLLSTSIFARQNNQIQTFLCGLMDVLRFDCSSVSSLSLLWIS